MRRKNVETLLALILVLITLAAVSCAGNEQASENNAENQPSTEDKQQTDKTQKHHRTRAEGSNGENTSGKARGKATLELRGDSGTEFSGSCTVGDQEPEEISGQVPESYSFTLKGRPLDCKISSEGDVQVVLTTGKNVRSVQRISGGTLNFTYENGSISSAVSSSSGSSSQGSSSSSQIISSSSGATGQQYNGAANGSNNVTSESRNVSGFDEVELDGIGNLSIEQTGSESLTVEAEESVLPKIRTEVEGNRLIIGPKPNTTINTTKPINYKLTVKDLNALKLSGSGNIDAQDISTDNLSVTIRGAGDVKASGTADRQGIEISGSGDYKAGDLESKEVKIDVGGSGSALVNVSDTLDAQVSGSGSVEYIGDPTVNKDVRGSGEVKQH